jgi:hypothetical protein
MATFRNTNDLKKDALERAGELADGNSSFDAAAIKFLNNAYHGLYAGGSEFGVDVDELWTWAKARRPIVLTLEPAFTTGTVTLTKGSTDGTFSSAPTDSQEGRFLKIEARDEYFRIRSHAGGAAAFEIDQGYTEDTGTFNFKSIPLEYELSDDLIVVDSDRNRIPFRDVAGTPLSAVLTDGVYTPSEFATEAKTQMELVGAQIYTITFNAITRKFTIASDGATFFLDFATGSSLESSLGPEIGYDTVDRNGAVSFEAENSLNAIYRLLRPMAVFRDIDPNIFFFEGVNTHHAFRNHSHVGPVEQGKIYGMDFNSMLRQFPLTHLTEGTPDKFAELEMRDNGVAKIRFNRFPSKQTRVEVEYIPVPQDLYDNVASIPKVPRAFRPFLAHAAAYHLMLQKSDNRATNEFNLAQAKLNGMIRANRSTLKETSNNFARLIPRR